MKLPENEDLRKWVEKNLGSDAATTVFSTTKLPDGDLQELQRKQLQCLITISAILLVQHQRLLRQLAGYNLILWVLMLIGFIIVSLN